jgi:uridine kinase
LRGKDSPAGYYYDSFDYEAVILYLLKPLGPAGDRIYRTSVFDHITDTELNGDAKTASDVVNDDPLAPTASIIVSADKTD